MGDRDTARYALKPEWVFGLSFFPGITGNLTTAFPGQEVCPSPMAVTFSLSENLTNTTRVHWTHRIKVVRGGNAASRAVNDAHCGLTVPPTLSDPLFSRSGRGCCLAGGGKDGGHSGQPVTFSFFLMGKCLLATLYGGGLAADGFCHVGPRGLKFTCHVSVLIGS